MKFMKLGSKPDSFQSNGDNIRYVATELATDVVVAVGDMKFYLHKFPLLSKSARLQKLVASSNEDSNAEDEFHVTDIPGGPAAFEICAKFCYGMTVTLNAYNVVAARCAAEYLEMYETVEKGNLVYKIEVFLNSSIFRSWKDSIIVLQTTRSLLPWSEELKLVGRGLDSIASKASTDTSGVKWSYSYNRDKVSSENSVRMPNVVPKDWWVEDLCELHIDLYKRIIPTVKSKGRVSPDVIGEALDAYATRRIPGFNNGVIQSGDFAKHKSVLETIIWMLPSERRSLSCSFLIKLLKAAIFLDCGEKERKELEKKIGQHLEHARVSDLLVRAPAGETTMYDVDFVKSLIEEFVQQDCKKNTELSCSDNAMEKAENHGFVSDASKAMVAKVIDGYLAEIATDPNLPLSKFLGIAEMVSRFPRPSHDGVYRAIDMFLKDHPGITKSERKRLCRLMDCRKLSPEACTHAVQNERLPLRVVVQVLFFEQVRAAAAAGSAGSTPPELPELPGPIKASLPPSGSHGSSRSTTAHTEEDWDSVPTGDDVSVRPNSVKTRGMVMSKMFSRFWSGKDSNGEISSSETSGSPGSATAEETKSTPSTSRRRSLS